MAGNPLWFDDYDFETLIVPGLLAASPGIAFLSALGYSLSALTGTTLLGVQAVAVLFIPLNQTLRNLGKELEVKLMKGTFPTAALLTSDTVPENQQRPMQQTMKRLTGIDVNRNATGDASYSANIVAANLAVNKVKEKLRQDKVLRRELKAYGYYRTLLALKFKLHKGLGALTLALLVLSLVVLILNRVYLPLAVSMFVAALLYVYLKFAITETTYHESANRYALQFFRSAENLDS